MTDLLSKFDPFIAEHKGLLDTGVNDPFGVVMERFMASSPAFPPPAEMWPE